MAASRRTQVLRLYRALLRESQGFSAYGYRTYAIRKIRDAFRENKNIKDSAEIETLVNKAKTNLEMIHRQKRDTHLQTHLLRVSQNCICKLCLEAKQKATVHLGEDSKPERRLAR